MERNELMLAALTSAALPSIVVAGVFPGATHLDGIDQAQVRDVTGKTYDVYASDTEEGRRGLAARVKAARALADAREPGGLGFALDRVIAFVPGDDPNGPTGSTAVMVAMHQDGRERDLGLLTLDDCSAMGTAIGAIHRLNPAFLQEAGYPVYVTGQIRAQLNAWIARLRHAGHVPSEITTSWARIMETEGLWSFATCLVHGGFEDGDVRFNGSTITAVNNWQNMQINDPARDLAWVFAKLDEDHRNAVLTAYGRMMGNRLDDLIMLRANLWVQMGQVGDFISALNRADAEKIVQFRAQVDRLAHQLGITVRKAEAQERAAARPAAPSPAGARPADATRAGDPPSTITVSTLLREGERRRAEAEAAARERSLREAPRDPASASVADDTADPDRTGPAHVAAAAEERDDTNRTPVHAAGEAVPSSSTSPTAQAQPPTFPVTARPVSGMHRPRPAGHSVLTDPSTDTATIVIPLLEREERALRHARAGVDVRDETYDAVPRNAGTWEESMSNVPRMPKMPSVPSMPAVAIPVAERTQDDADIDMDDDDTGEKTIAVHTRMTDGGRTFEAPEDDDTDERDVTAETSEASDDDTNERDVVMDDVSSDDTDDDTDERNVTPSETERNERDEAAADVSDDTGEAMTTPNA